MMSPVVAASDRHSTSPLPGLRRHLGQRDLAADHPRTGGDGPDLGVVGGAGVQHDQLVDQAAEQRCDGLDDAGDGLFFVERGQHHRDGAAGLGGHQFGDGPRRSVPAVVGQPPAR